MNYTPSYRPLGSLYSKTSTVFRVWAPTHKVSLLVFESIEEDRYSRYPMVAHHDGSHDVEVIGDLCGKYYLYELEDGTRVVDPYCLGTSINSTYSAVIDLVKTNPEGFQSHERPDLDYRDAVIYETHIRDFTVDPEAGFSLPGKFLSFSESKEFEGNKIGIDYVKDLGVTHIHLMPIQDFATVDEEKGGYNWGYDPLLYFNVEGSYVVDHSDPHNRLKEFKSLVQKIHEKGMGVIMDVVYNHTYHSYDSIYNILAPNYCYRLDSNGEFTNGSGVGNELDSEKSMVGRLILESLLFFVRECKVDGFRFDLLGLMDVSRTREIIRSLRQENDKIIIYGEPWAGGQSALNVNKMTLHGSQKGEAFALFNDIYRNALKGYNDDDSKGYVQGNIYGRNTVLSGITGSIPFSDQIFGFTSEPYETINYHSSHDNLILYDKLVKSSEDSIEHIARLTKLCFAVQIMSFGIVFMHAGTEFLRSKSMSPNTYNLGDEINMIRWNDLIGNKDVSDYVRELIALRKSITAFRKFSADDIREHLVFMYSKIEIMYMLELDEGPYERLFIAHNPTNEIITVPVELEKSIVLVHNGEVKNKQYTNEQLMPYSTLIVGFEKGE